MCIERIAEAKQISEGIAIIVYFAKKKEANKQLIVQRNEWQ